MKADCSFREDATACASTVPATADLDVKWRLFCLRLRLAGGGGETSPRFIARFSWSWTLRCLFEKGFLRGMGEEMDMWREMTIIAIVVDRGDPDFERLGNKGTGSPTVNRISSL